MIAKWVLEDNLNFGIEISKIGSSLHIEMGCFDDGTFSELDIPLEEFKDMLKAVKIGVL